MKVAFLDRDGVINEKAPDQHYITRKEDFIFNEGIFDVCKILQERGYEFIIVTNQRGIAHSLYSEEDLKNIHEFMISEFAKRSVPVLDIFYCPHENGVCECRKPKPGLLIKAREKYPIGLSESIFITDSVSEVSMGESFGIGKTYLISSDCPEELLPLL